MTFDPSALSSLILDDTGCRQYRTVQYSTCIHGSLQAQTNSAQSFDWGSNSFAAGIWMQSKSRVSQMKNQTRSQNQSNSQSKPVKNFLGTVARDDGSDHRQHTERHQATPRRLQGQVHPLFSPKASDGQGLRRRRQERRQGQGRRAEEAGHALGACGSAGEVRRRSRFRMNRGLRGGAMRSQRRALATPRALAACCTAPTGIAACPLPRARPPPSPFALCPQAPFPLGYC